MQCSVLFPILLSFKVNYLLHAAGLVFLAGEQKLLLAAARSQFFLKSSEYNVSQHGMNMPVGEQEPSPTLPRRSLTRWQWQRPERSFSAFFVGAIAATMCIAFLMLSCFRSLVAKHGSPGTKRRLRDPRVPWACNVSNVRKHCFLS